MALREFDAQWEEHFDKLDKSVQLRVWKSIRQLNLDAPGRHLQHRVPYFVKELGQYRLCYNVNKKENKIIFYFAGTHKDYEKWARNQTFLR